MSKVRKPYLVALSLALLAGLAYGAFIRIDSTRTASDAVAFDKAAAELNALDLPKGVAHATGEECGPGPRLGGSLCLTSMYSMPATVRLMAGAIGPTEGDGECVSLSSSPPTSCRVYGSIAGIPAVLDVWSHRLLDPERSLEVVPAHGSVVHLSLVAGDSRR